MENSKKYFQGTKELIDQTMHKYLYVLIKYIFFEGNLNKRTKELLYSFTHKINEAYNINIILNTKKGKTWYSFDNLKKILNFAKEQNFVFISEILENIIIRVLSFAFKVNSQDCFGKFIYNDLKALKEEKGKKMIEWIVNDHLQIFKDIDDGGQQKAKDNIINILKHDIGYDVLYNKAKFDKVKKDNLFIKNNAFAQFLYELNLIRYVANNELKNYNNKQTEETTFGTVSKSTINELKSCYLFQSSLNIKEKDYKLPIILSLLISIYIYYQNENSPLMNYTNDSEKLSKLNFIYDISEAAINDCYLNIIIKPIRIEPKIEELKFNKNRFGFEGILELHKAILFNKGIKKISIKNCLIKSYYLLTFAKNFNLFRNDNIEELDISFNYLQNDASIYLEKLISILRGLKTLILSYNFFKNGLSTLFVSLKKLYRQNKTKLDKLILVKCQLDDISFYELGELLKSKYCKLKCLCLNENKIPSDVNFFNALKKNKSLKEIYLYDCGISSDKVDEINKIISNSNLECLYINGNPIYDFNQYISILYRNSLVKFEKEKKRDDYFIDNPCLFNLNLNETDCFNRNSDKIILIKEGIDRTNLTLLDLTSVFQGFKYKSLYTKEYYYELQMIIEDLKEKQDDYINALKNIFENDILVKEYENKLENIFRDEFKDLESNVKKIIKDPNSKNYFFIRRKSEELKNTSINNSETEKNNRVEKLINYFRYRIAKNIIEENTKTRDKKKMILI